MQAAQVMGIHGPARRRIGIKAFLPLVFAVLAMDFSKITLNRLKSFNTQKSRWPLGPIG